LTHGSEFDQCAAHALLGDEGVDLLAKDGKKILIQAAIPGNVALEASNGVWSIDEIRARGEAPQMVGKFISVWSYRIAHPSFDPKHSHVGFDVAVKTAVPASWIRRIETLED